MRLFLAVLLTFAFSSGTARADKTAEALMLMTATLDSICESVPIDGRSSDLRLTGEATAQLKGLISKLADLGIEGAVEYDLREYEGVLHSELGTTLSEVRACKQRMFHDLKDILLPKPSREDQFGHSEFMRYSVIIAVDQSKDNLGRGWDWPVQNPDPYVCISNPNAPDERFCTDVNSPNWSCSDQWNCEMSIQAPKYTRSTITVTALDKDGDEDDLIGQGECEFDVPCRLKNNRRGWNSAELKITLAE